MNELRVRAMPDKRIWGLLSESLGRVQPHTYSVGHQLAPDEAGHHAVDQAHGAHLFAALGARGEEDPLAEGKPG